MSQWNGRKKEVGKRRNDDEVRRQACMATNRFLSGFAAIGNPKARFQYTSRGI